MKPVVFLGASLSQEEARSVLAADFRPPVRAGDLDSLPDDATVAIIDGLLDPEQRLPTTEAERALDRGVRLCGAASTGALLAAELEQAGMVGVGRIFLFLRRFREEGEDLVAVLQRENDSRPVTVPLINIVLSLLDQSRIEPAQLKSLLKRLRAIPLTQRYRNTVSAELESVLQEHSFGNSQFPIADHKASDAFLLLHLLHAPKFYLRF